MVYDWKLAVRKIRENRWFFWINLLGLSTGIICTIWIASWVKNEFDFDRHFKNADQIYRFTIAVKRTDGYQAHFARNHQFWVNHIPDFFSHVESMARFSPMGRTSFKQEVTRFSSTKVFRVNPDALKVFDIRILMGDTSRALSEPGSLIISESLANQYFPERPIVGTILEVAGIYDVDFSDFKVTGIFRDFPENSHMHPEILISMDDPDSFNGWSYTYLKLFENTDPDEILDQFSAFKQQYIPHDEQQSITPFLQHITDIHLYSDKDREIEKNGSIKTVISFIMAALLIYLMAVINYVNLQLLAMDERKKMFMIRKILGGTHLQLLKNLSAESILSGLIVFLFVTAFLPLLNHVFPEMIFGKDDWPFILLSGGILISIATIAGILSQFWMIVQCSGISIRMLKPGYSFTGNKSGLKKALVIIQFSISIILIISAIYINQQKNFMYDKRLGSSQKQVLVLDGLNWIQKEKYGEFKNRLLENPAILSVTGIMEEPSGQTMDAMKFEMSGIQNDLKDNSLYVLPVDDNFLDFFGLDLICGENFSPYSPGHNREDYILNESAVRFLGFDNPEEVLGRNFTLNFAIDSIFYGGQIRGVVRDFYFSTMDKRIKPLVLFQKPIWYWVVLIKIDPALYGDGIRHTKTVWDQVFPSFVFDYSFNDDLYRKAYAEEFSQAELSRNFTIISAIIAMIGLFSVSSSLIGMRTKEIGIRKANGAYWKDILIMLYRNYLSWILTSMILAFPVAWGLMLKWNENYPENPPPSWDLFILAGSFVIIIAWIAISFQAGKAARINPAVALKYE